jgi:triosephosphate isomerase (TIM)
MILAQGFGDQWNHCLTKWKPSRRQVGAKWKQVMSGELRRPLLAGNWKMNGLRAAIADFAEIARGAGGILGADLLVCPPATLIMACTEAAAGTRLQVGAQDCHAQPAGAFTGDLSAEMLKDAGATAVILGHSERRTYHKEIDAEVRAKANAARRAGLLAIICVGETRGQRESGSALATVGAQLRGSLPDEFSENDLVVAYEPVWAIGTGLTPTATDVIEMHQYIRQSLGARFGRDMTNARVLYGGSVKDTNAQELMNITDVDGALVGGASLDPREFLAIASVFR